MLGETFDAAAALAMGLVDAVFSAAMLDAAVEARLTSLLANGPKAIRLQKALIRQWEDMTLSQAVRAGIFKRRCPALASGRQSIGSIGEGAACCTSPANWPSIPSCRSNPAGSAWGSTCPACNTA